MGVNPEITAAGISEPSSKNKQGFEKWLIKHKETANDLTKDTRTRTVLLVSQDTRNADEMKRTGHA